jgi:ABC-2 type transport system ATP-binding protein
VSTSTPVIRVQDVSKRFIIHKEKSIKERVVNFGRSQKYKEDFWALHNVSFDVQPGTTVGLIGPNGSGKSTLLKAIGGIIQPTSGTVQRRGRLAALLELGAGFHPDLTGRENVYLNAAILGLTRKQTDQNFDSILEFAGIEKFIDTQVKFYSSGMYVRLAFAVAIHVDPEVLLVDEVLAVGDEPFQRKCMDRIRAFQAEGRTIVLVSHSLETVGDICDRGIVLREGVVQFDGETATALRVLRDGFEAARASEPVKGDDPKGFARIGSVKLLDSKTSKEVTLINAGDSLRMEIEVFTKSELRDWVVGMGIETPLGQSVFGTNTTRLGLHPEPFSGRRTIAIDLPNVNLGNGQYFFHASLGTIQKGSFTRIPQAAALEVADGTENLGMLSVRASLVESAQSAKRSA